MTKTIEDKVEVKKLYCADIEADSLSATKVWVNSMSELNPVTMEVIRSFSLVDMAKIKELIADPDIFWVYHNGWSYDKPTLERLVGAFKGTMIDSLGVSWYLEPKRNLHGLGAYGEEFGVPKPEVEDWENEDVEVYINRCEEDVKIQVKLWQRQWKHLMLLYKDVDKAWRCALYLSNKMKALSIAQDSKWKVSQNESQQLISMFEDKFEEAKEALEVNLPKIPVYANKERPKKPFKKDGTKSATGYRWELICQEHNLDFDFKGVVKHQTGWKEPNAGSHKQVKDWLYSLGWIPKTFDFKRDKETGDIRKIPQLKIKDTGELCPSVSKFIVDFSAVQYLQDMGVLSHRKSVVNGFVKASDSEGCIIAGAQGFTNTLRLRHKVFLNVPSIRKPWGKEIRALLTSKNDTTELIGSDMCSLEDRIKMHYMMPFDPKFVKKMQSKDYDPHTTMAITAGFMTPKEEGDYKKLNSADKEELTKDLYKELERLGLIRHKGKSTNYASVYGAGPATIARAAGVTQKEGELLHKAYWKLNWSVRAIADSCKVVESRGMKWLWNPVAKLYYYLKTDKDRFSTLAQGTGSYVFDVWVDYIINRRPQINGQAHDEIILEIKKGNRDKAEKLLKEAIGYVNKVTKLRVPLDVDLQYGSNYSEIH